MNPSPHPDADVDHLRVENLHFAHPGEPALIVHWSASIGPGVTLVHGDTGSGKTTLLALLAGARRGTGTGRLTLAGVGLDVDLEADADVDAYRRQVFFGDPSSDAHAALTARACTTMLSVGDALFSPMRWHGLVEGFALTEHLDKPIYMLSTGTRRKVWLAAALASGRALIALDEPTSGLDAASRACLWRALGEVGARHIVLVASAERIDKVPLTATIELPLT